MLRFIQRNPWRITLFILFIVIIAFVRIFNIGSWINVQTLEQYRDALIAYVNSHYWQSVAIFISAYAVENIFALPFSFALSIAGGFLYGIPAAVAYVVVGATSGAVLSFLVTRYLVGIKLQEYYRNLLDRFNRELSRNGVYYLIILRLIPVVPFFLINILSGLTNISLVTFTGATAVGILPGAIVYTSAGYQLRTVDAIGDIFTWDMLLVLVLLVLFAMTPVIIKKWYDWDLLQQE